MLYKRFRFRARSRDEARAPGNLAPVRAHNAPFGDRVHASFVVGVSAWCARAWLAHSGGVRVVLGERVHGRRLARAPVDATVSLVALCGTDYTACGAMPRQIRRVTMRSTSSIAWFSAWHVGVA